MKWIFGLIILVIVLFSGFGNALIADTTAVSINKGWNLVSVPYSDFAITKSENSNSADCDMQTIKLIYHYDPASGKYIKIDVLEKMIPGQGYWIYSANACAIEFSGMNYVDHNGLELSKGWNQISGTELFNIDDYKGDCVFGKKIGYDSFATDSQKKYYETDFLEPGKAYFVYANEKCRLAEPKPKAILAVADKSALTAEEKKFYDEMKTYSDPVLMNIEDAANEKISYPAFVADYYAGSGINTITGKATDESRKKADQAAKKLSSSGKDIIFIGSAKQYKQTPKEETVYKKFEIHSSDLATSANPRLISMTRGFEKPVETALNSLTINPTGLAIPRNGVVRDEYGNLFLIYTYNIVKMIDVGKFSYGNEYEYIYNSPYWDKRTFVFESVGIAVSKDNGKTWKYLGASKIPEVEKSIATTAMSTISITNENKQNCEKDYRISCEYTCDELKKEDCGNIPNPVFKADCEKLYVGACSVKERTMSSGDAKQIEKYQRNPA